MDFFRTTDFEVSTVNESVLAKKDVEMPKVKGATDINNTQDLKGNKRYIGMIFSVLICINACE